ncbi:MAG: hypothetical protein ACF8LK_10510, partial [Phycisphaerales bacterium JB041]
MIERPGGDHEHPPAASLEVLARNLRALSRCSAETARLIEQAAPAPDVRFEIAADGGLTGTIGDGAAARRLASGRRPLDEAARLAD